MERGPRPVGRTEFTPQVRFGPFELDLRAGELRKHGRRVRLQEQPFQILRILLESPGEVVTREDIRKHLWPDNTVVEFEHSINAAVRRLRDALSDSPDTPRYIKTLARRGYCFIGEVEPVRRPSPLPEPVPDISGNGQPGQTPPSPDRPGPYRIQPRFVAAALITAVVAALGSGVRYYGDGMRPIQAPPLAPLMRLDVDLGDDPPTSDRGADAILSPDGTRLAYISGARLFTRLLDQRNSTELTGMENPKAPFFSPDGQWIAFFSAAGTLKKISVQGGPAKVLCDGGLAGGGSWGKDGNIIAGLDLFLSQVSASGGIPRRLTELRTGEVAQRWPQILPGGKAVLFTTYSSMTGSDAANIEAMSLSDRSRKVVIRGGSFGRYLTSGHLIYLNKGALFAAPFDAKRLEVVGAPTPVVEGVAYSAAWGSAQVDISNTGTLIYRSGRGGTGMVTVQLLDRAGSASPLMTVPGNYLSPTFSPDGNRVALTSSGDIWIYDLPRAAMLRLTFGGGYGNPVWTGDGRYVVFRAAKGMWWARADGTGEPQELMHSNNLQVPWSFTPQGKRLAYVEPGSTSGADIWTVPLEDGHSGLRAGKPEVFLQTRFDERCPMISPDGHWMAYMSNESGDYQVYVESFPDKHGKRQISIIPGTYPAWSHNERELFYWQSGGKKLMVASYKANGNSFVADRPHVWTERGLVSFSTTRSYDPHPDGKRVLALMLEDIPEEHHDRLVFLLNFFDELRRRAPLRTIE